MGTIPKKESVYGMNVGQDSLKNPHWQPEEQCLKDVCDYEAQYRFGFLGNFKFDLENIIYKEEACKKKTSEEAIPILHCVFRFFVEFGAYKQCFEASLVQNINYF